MAFIYQICFKDDESDKALCFAYQQWRFDCEVDDRSKNDNPRKRMFPMIEYRCDTELFSRV